MSNVLHSHSFCVCVCDILVMGESLDPLLIPPLGSLFSPSRSLPMAYRRTPRLASPSPLWLAQISSPMGLWIHSWNKLHSLCHEASAQVSFLFGKPFLLFAFLCTIQSKLPSYRQSWALQPHLQLLPQFKFIIQCPSTLPDSKLQEGWDFCCL